MGMFVLKAPTILLHFRSFRIICSCVIILIGEDYIYFVSEAKITEPLTCSWSRPKEIEEMKG
jgi:hypothetical protein